MMNWCIRTEAYHLIRTVNVCGHISQAYFLAKWRLLFIYQF